MTKSELIKKIHSNTDFNYAEIEQITDCVFELISQGLIEDDKVVISGFGTFEKVEQSAYIGVNPHTGEKMQVNAFNKIRFTTGKSLKNRIN